ncbi:TetR/AcrR family transcriptional regulator [Bordetella bronchialis]|nr:TetR/AcrR family transcriptional regulator [Bordetella bronchialis]
MASLTDKPGRRDRKRAWMLAHLSATGARLFEERGYESVTMEQIAAQADVAKRTLYNHFPTKEALLAHWVDAQLERDLAGLRDDIAKRRTFLSRVSCILDASAQWCEAHPAYLKAYLEHRFLAIGSEPRPGDGQTGDIAIVWRQLIAAGQQAGELRTDFPADQLASSYHHLYLGALLRWLHRPGLALRKEFAAITRLFLQGAGARPESPGPAAAGATGSKTARRTRKA